MACTTHGATCGVRDTARHTARLVACVTRCDTWRRRHTTQLVVWVMHSATPGVGDTWRDSWHDTWRRRHTTQLVVWATRRNSFHGRRKMQLMVQAMMHGATHGAGDIRRTRGATHDATCGVGDTAQLIPWATHGTTCGTGDAQRNSWHGQHTAQLVAQGTHGATHGAGAPFVVRPFPPLHINHYCFDHCPLPL